MNGKSDQSGDAGSESRVVDTADDIQIDAAGVPETIPPLAAIDVQIAATASENEYELLVRVLSAARFGHSRAVVRGDGLV